LRVQLTNTSPEDSIRISTLSEENRSLQSEVEERNTKIEKLTKELEETRIQLAKVKKQLSQYTSPLSIRLSSTDPPSASEWKIVQTKIHSLLSKPSPETVSALQSIETLSSQVKTLEVLKNDADAEITRLKGELDVGTIDLKSMPASSSRRAPTVTIHKQTPHSLLREPSSEAVSFVESVGVKTKRAASMRAGAPSGVGQCIQQ
jgi:chromosome segregation ATPase